VENPRRKVRMELFQFLQRVALRIVPLSVDFADVAGSDEAFNAIGLDIVHQGGEFGVGENGLQFHVLLAGIAADEREEAAAPVKFVYYVAAEPFVLGRDDAHALLAVEAGHEIVHREAVDPGADDADDHHAERVDGEGAAADERAGHGDGSAYVEVEVFVDYLGNDVESARGSVDIEEDGLGDAEEQHEAQEVEPGVAHQRGGTGFGDLLEWQDGRPEVHQRTEDHGGIDRLQAELLPYQEPREHKQHGVDQRDHPGDLESDPEIGQDGGKHDREAGYAADDELAGNEEIIDACGTHGHSESHYDEFLPELPGKDLFE